MPEGHEKLQNSDKSIESIFIDTNTQRNNIIANKNLFTQVDYKNRGIKSDELKTIIKNANGYAASKNRKK